MSTIVVVVKSAQPSAELLRQLREATKKPLGEIQRALRSGSPLVSARLYYNDHDEQAELLRALVKATSDTGTPAEAYELEEDESYVEGQFDDCRFELDEVIGILEERDRRVQRIRSLDDIKGRTP